MNFKFAFAASAMMALAGVFTMVGCGGDDCTKATDHLAECLNVSAGSASASGSVACEGSTLCAAQCINAADCTAIKDAFSGMPTSASKSFLDCSTKCATAK
ncbi:MAG: hypothetical protein U0359_17670 [Byssovorax sp.]